MSEYKFSDIFIPGIKPRVPSASVPSDEISPDTLEKAHLRDQQKREIRQQQEQRPEMRIGVNIEDFQRAQYEQWKRTQDAPKAPTPPRRDRHNDYDY